MGKRYYCDYCDKNMVATPCIVKTHNKGLPHQKLVQAHYQRYKDPETILAEENNKKPCTRFASGECTFGPICRFSHYMREELYSIKQFVESKNALKSNFTQPSFEDLYHKLQSERTNKIKESNNTTVMYDKNGMTYVFPWIYNSVLDAYGDNLPPSIKRMKIEDFANANITEWG